MFKKPRGKKPHDITCTSLQGVCTHVRLLDTFWLSSSKLLKGFSFWTALPGYRNAASRACCCSIMTFANMLVLSLYCVQRIKCCPRQILYARGSTLRHVTRLNWMYSYKPTHLPEILCLAYGLHLQYWTIFRLQCYFTCWTYQLMYSRTNSTIFHSNTTVNSVLQSQLFNHVVFYLVITVQDIVLAWRGNIISLVTYTSSLHCCTCELWEQSHHPCT